MCSSQKSVNSVRVVSERSCSEVHGLRGQSILDVIRTNIELRFRFGASVEITVAVILFRSDGKS